MSEFNPFYRNTGTFRPKAFRKATKMQMLRAEIEGHKGLNKLLQQNVDALMDMNKKLVAKLAEMGFKVSYHKTGEVTIDVIKT